MPWERPTDDLEPAFNTEEALAIMASMALFVVLIWWLL
jgi:hypothetical protein